MVGWLNVSPCGRQGSDPRGLAAELRTPTSESLWDLLKCLLKHSLFQKKILRRCLCKEKAPSLNKEPRMETPEAPVATRMSQLEHGKSRVQDGLSVGNVPAPGRVPPHNEGHKEDPASLVWAFSTSTVL